MLNNFINQFSLSKTLRFELKPVGRTLETIKEQQIIEEGFKKIQPI